MSIAFFGGLQDAQRHESGRVSFYGSRLSKMAPDELQRELNEQVSKHVTSGLREETVVLLRDVAAKRGFGSNYVPMLIQAEQKRQAMLELQRQDSLIPSFVKNNRPR